MIRQCQQFNEFNKAATGGRETYHERLAGEVMRLTNVETCMAETVTLSDTAFALQRAQPCKIINWSFVEAPMKKHRSAALPSAASFLSISILLVICTALVGCEKSTSNKKVFNESKTQLALFIETSEAKYKSGRNFYDINDLCKRQLLDLLAASSIGKNDIKLEILESFIFTAGKESNAKTTRTLYVMRIKDNRILLGDFDGEFYYEIDSKGFQNLIQEIVGPK